MAQPREALEATVHRDFRIDRALSDVRYSHYKEANGDWYFLVNQGDACRFEASMQGSGKLYAVDVTRRCVERLDSRAMENRVSVQLSMARFESLLLYISEDDLTRH